MKLLLLTFFLVSLLLSCNSDTSTTKIKKAASTKIDQGTASINHEKVAAIVPEVPLPFDSKDGRFSIVFPDTPKENKHISTSEIGQIELTQYIYGKDDIHAWVASFSDYPEQMIQIGNKEQLLKGIKYRILEDLRAKVVVENKIKLEDKYDGLSFVAKAKKKDLNISYQVFLVKNRVYQLSMYSSIGPIETQDSIDFFGSFKLFPKDK